jgi:integrase
VTTAELNGLYLSLSAYRSRANRVNGYVRSLFSWAGRHSYVPRDFNPARHVKPYKEQGRERYLLSEELMRLGEVLRQAETSGIAWVTKVEGAKAKQENQVIRYPAEVTNAIRLLLFTGCRLGEILNLRSGEVYRVICSGEDAMRWPEEDIGNLRVALNATYPYPSPGSGARRSRRTQVQTGQLFTG